MTAGGIKVRAPKQVPRWRVGTPVSAAHLNSMVEQGNAVARAVDPARQVRRVGIGQPGAPLLTLTPYVRIDPSSNVIGLDTTASGEVYIDRGQKKEIVAPSGPVIYDFRVYSRVYDVETGASARINLTTAPGGTFSDYRQSSSNQDYYRVDAGGSHRGLFAATPIAGNYGTEDAGVDFRRFEARSIEIRDQGVLIYTTTSFEFDAPFQFGGGIFWRPIKEPT